MVNHEVKNMKINVEDIKENLGEFKELSFKEQIEDLKFQGRDIKVVKPAQMEFQVFNTDDSFLVTGSIELELNVACSRCLERFNLPVSIDLEEEVDKEEVELIDNQAMIDITKEIDDSIMLAIPMQPVCDEDCAGLCPSCGQNLNEADCDCFMHTVDPRLAKLEKLLDKE